MFRTISLDLLRVPLITHGEIQVFFPAGALGDDADTMEIRGNVFDTIELHEYVSVNKRKVTVQASLRGMMIRYLARWRKSKLVLVLALGMAQRWMFVKRLKYHELLISVGYNLSCLDGRNEYVIVAKSVHDAVPELSMREDRGGGGRIDGLCVSFDDDNHNGNW